MEASPKTRLTMPIKEKSCLFPKTWFETFFSDKKFCDYETTTKKWEKGQNYRLSQLEREIKRERERGRKKQ